MSPSPWEGHGLGALRLPWASRGAGVGAGVSSSLSRMEMTSIGLVMVATAVNVMTT